MKQQGFVLMEIVVILGMMAVIGGLITINLLGSARRASLTEAATILVSDIQSQQTKAMTGALISGIIPAGYGIHFESGRYTLFYGSSFVATDPTNSSVELKSPVVAGSIGFPGGTLLFLPKSGEVSGFSQGQNSVTLLHTDSNQSQTIEVNRYGVITSIN